MLNKIRLNLNVNQRIEKISIVDQFKNACIVNSNSLVDYILHTLSFGWKVILFI